MASGSFAVTTTNGHVKGTCSWSSTPNTAGNYSDVYIELRLGRDNTGYTTYGTGSFQVGVSGWGSLDSGSIGFTLTYNSNTLMVNGTIRVNHNADGTAQITVWADGNSDVFDVTYASGSGWLDTIPRASSLTSSCDWTAGISNLPITVSRASTDFHHSIEVWIQKPDGTWAWVCNRDWIYTSDTVVFSQSETTLIYQDIGGYENRPSKIHLVTYDSSNREIGSKDFFGTCYGATPATISFNDFNIGDSIPANLINMYSGFTYSGTLTFGSFTKNFTFDPAVPNPTLTFTAEEVQSLFAQIPNANAGIGSIFISSKWNGVEINDGIPVNQSKNFTAFVVNSNPTFGTSYTYKDTNTATTGITADNQSIIQSKSTVLVEIPTTAKATAINGATMATYEVSLNGVTKSANYSSSATVSFDFGTVSAGADLTLTVTAIDSRGNRTPTTKTVKILPYSAPTIDATASRLNNFEASTTLTLKGKASTLTVGGTIKNDVTTVQYRYKDTGTSTWGAWTNFAFTKALPDYTATNVALTLDNVKSWNIQIQVIDKLSTSTVDLLVNTGQPVFFPDVVKKGVGINKFPDIGKALDINGDSATSGDYYEGGTKLIDKYAPAGMVSVFGGATAPSGWLLCQGQAVSRTTYSRLFAVIGTTYGTGDGSTTFNLPNLKGCIPVGFDSGQTEFNALGKTGGEKAHTLTTNEMPNHGHNVKYNNGKWLSLNGGNNDPATQQYNLSWGLQGWGGEIFAEATGGGQAHYNLQPFVTMNFIIKI